MDEGWWVARTTTPLTSWEVRAREAKYTWFGKISNETVEAKRPWRRRIHDAATQPCTCVKRKKKGGAALFAKLLAPAGSGNHARRPVESRLVKKTSYT